jgi:hypothetical protein
MSKKVLTTSGFLHRKQAALMLSDPLLRAWRVDQHLHGFKVAERSSALRSLVVVALTCCVVRDAVNAGEGGELWHAAYGGWDPD